VGLTRVCDVCKQPGLADNVVNHMYLRMDFWIDGKRTTRNQGSIDLCVRCWRNINDKNLRKRERNTHDDPR
jgi:hypothetical protein